MGLFAQRLGTAVKAGLLGPSPPGADAVWVSAIAMLMAKWVFLVLNRQAETDCVRTGVVPVLCLSSESRERLL